jgi:hypothetical protein
MLVLPAGSIGGKFRARIKKGFVASRLWWMLGHVLLHSHCSLSLFAQHEMRYAHTHPTPIENRNSEQYEGLQHCFKFRKGLSGRDSCARHPASVVPSRVGHVILSSFGAKVAGGDVSLVALVALRQVLLSGCTAAGSVSILNQILMQLCKLLQWRSHCPTQLKTTVRQFQ